MSKQKLELAGHAASAAARAVLEGERGAVTVLITDDSRHTYVSSSVDDPRELAKYLRAVADAEEHQARDDNAETVH